MAFYVSFSSVAQRRQIHLGTCPDCREGQAVDRNIQKNTGWSPAFRTLSEARAYAMRMFPNFKDAGACDSCVSGERARKPGWLKKMRRRVAGLTRPLTGGKALEQRD